MDHNRKQVILEKLAATGLEWVGAKAIGYPLIAGATRSVSKTLIRARIEKAVRRGHRWDKYLSVGQKKALKTSPQLKNFGQGLKGSKTKELGIWKGKRPETRRTRILNKVGL